MAVPKAVTIKEALKLWEEKHPGDEPAEAREIKMNGVFPPIEKMDATIGTLTNVENALLTLTLMDGHGFHLFSHKCGTYRKLSLSTNMIDKITGLQGLKNLKILSLGRNYIKSLSGLEHVAETLEELWVSYNQIEKLKGVGTLKNLRVLYMSNNLVKDWAEFDRLKDLPRLDDLVFENNPLQQRYGSWRDWCLQGVLPRLPNLIKLEGKPTVEAKTGADDDADSNSGKDKDYGTLGGRDRHGGSAGMTDAEDDHDHSGGSDVASNASPTRDGNRTDGHNPETTDDEPDQ